MRGLLIFTAFVLISFTSCEEEECVGCNLNPRVKIDFQAGERLEITDSLFVAVKDSIAMLLDSLSGVLAQEQVQIIETKLASLRIDSTLLNDVKVATNKNINVLFK